MRVLLDSCVWGRAAERLAQAGHDAEWAGSWLEDPGDEELLTYALREDRVLVTLDKDFGELAVVRGQAHAGIIRLVGFAAPQQAEVCLEILGRYGDELRNRGLITVNPVRVRIRPAEER